MQLLFATFTVSERLLHALSWTLLHSLWQGALIAFLAGILFFGAAYWSANVRYNLLLGLMVLFIAMTSFSFWREWDKTEAKSHELPVSTNKFEAKTDLIISLSDAISTNSFDKKNNWVQWFERYHVLLLFIWALVLILKSIKMCLDIAYTYKVRTFKTKPAALIWSSRLHALAKQLGVKQAVLLLESGIIQGPATLGFFKPLILLPIGLINHLSVAQVEAILLHELAHIRRNDYLVNLLQCVLENIFFFNPALLWLSQRIREERENCCDDLAVQVLQDKQLYAQTLLRFQEYQWGERQYAQAFGGNKAPLLTRIKRILNLHEYQALHIYEKITLIFSLLLVGGYLLWAKPQSLQEINFVKKPKEQVSSPTVVPIESTPFLTQIADDSSVEAQTNLLTPAQEAQPETPTPDNWLKPSSHLEDTMPTTKAELAQLQADLAFTTKQYEREKSRYDSIRALAANTLDRGGSQFVHNPTFQEHILKSLGADLIADGIIKDAQALRSYRLDETTFKVNGRKQTKELIEKYQQRYIRNPSKGNYLRIMKVNQRVYVQRIDNAQTNQ